MKRLCKKCSLLLPLEEFYPLDKTNTRQFYKCIKCYNAAVKIYRDSILRSNPEWCERTRARARTNHHRRKLLGKITLNNKISLQRATKRWAQNHPDKKKAHRKVNKAIARGELLRSWCEVCGAGNTHAHHEDYSKPFDVIWLCPKHHAERHRNMKGLQPKAI